MRDRGLSTQVEESAVWAKRENCFNNFLRYVFLNRYLFTLTLLLGFFPIVVFGDPYPFVIFSPPKCGTHLHAKVVSQICGRPPSIYLCGMGSTVEEALQLVNKAAQEGSFVVAHHFTPSILEILIQRGYRVIFIVRDPRDQLISVMNWMREGQWYWLPVSKIHDQALQIEELITGERLGWRCFPKCFLQFEQFLQVVPKDRLLKSRFEYLVGPRGGGSEEDQIEAIHQIATFLGVEMTIEEAERIARGAFGGPGTFRRGQIGAWKSYFTELHKTLFKELYQSELERLGYEQTASW